MARKSILVAWTCLILLGLSAVGIARKPALKLSEADEKAVRAAVSEADKKEGKRIIGIRVISADECEVTTGDDPETHQLAGFGKIFKLKKADGKWRVMEVGSWVS